VLSKRRQDLVEQVFTLLDKNKSGTLEYEDIKGVYNARSHPDVIANRRTEQDILDEFLLNFEVHRNLKQKQKRGAVVVTKKDFSNYYANISASIDLDDYFELMLRNAWHLSGGEGWSANTSNRRVLVTHADGRQTVEEVKNDLGMKGDSDLLQRLNAQGINDIAKLDTKGGGAGDSKTTSNNIKEPQNSLASYLQTNIPRNPQTDNSSVKNNQTSSNVDIRVGNSRSLLQHAMQRKTNATPIVVTPSAVPTIPPSKAAPESLLDRLNSTNPRQLNIQINYNQGNVHFVCISMIY
jgi:hypothetical protein